MKTALTKAAEARGRRPAIAEVVSLLILIAASIMLATIVLYWGLAFQGQSNTNLGVAISGSNAQASEQVSIDNVRFTTVTSGCAGGGSHCYAALVYVRNFGDQPIRLAAIDVLVLGSGIAPGGVQCDVTSSPARTTPAAIVARSMLPVNLDIASGSQSPTTPGCVAGTGGAFSSTWNGQTISIQLSTDLGTRYSANFEVPS